MGGRSVVHGRATPCGVRGPAVSCSRSRASAAATTTASKLRCKTRWLGLGRETALLHGGSGSGGCLRFGRVAARAAEDSLSPISPSSSDSAAVDGAIPAEVQVMFKEAQQRILDLNQSRLHALEELAEARAKIIDLGKFVPERPAQSRQHCPSGHLKRTKGGRGAAHSLTDLFLLHLPRLLVGPSREQRSG